MQGSWCGQLSLSMCSIPAVAPPQSMSYMYVSGVFVLLFVMQGVGCGHLQRSAAAHLRVCPV